MKNNEIVLNNKKMHLKNKEIISTDRKKYLKDIKVKRFTILFFQIIIFVGFIVIWEILGDLEIIDTFIMSQPSRILDTFMNLTSNNLLQHIAVTTYETAVGFLIGTFLRNYNCYNFMVV